MACLQERLCYSTKINSIIKILKIKVMLTVLEVALFLAVIIVPLTPARKTAK
jgi:hypothetical protein